MEIIEYTAAGLCIWFMAATIAFLLTGLSPASRTREPSPRAIILMAPVLLVVALTRPLEHGVERIFFSRET